VRELQGDAVPEPVQSVLEASHYWGGSIRRKLHRRAWYLTVRRSERASRAARIVEDATLPLMKDPRPNNPRAMVLKAVIYSFPARQDRPQTLRATSEQYCHTVLKKSGEAQAPVNHVVPLMPHWS
jgi:hypothetical protein